MTRHAAGSALLAACLSLGTAVPSLSVPANGAAEADKPDQKCTSDLRAFDAELQKDGYWLHDSGYGYGHLMYGYMFGERGTMLPSGTSSTATEWHAWPGYEIRTLMASANIMTQRGQQPACEALLAVTRDIYDYATDLRNRGVAKADMSGWRSQLIATAQSVTAGTTSLRSDQLIDADVVNPQSENLGSVDDIVLSPQTGKIAYLVIGRGGVFGIDEKYVPVPWKDFRVTTGPTLLVLDTTKNNLDAGPQVKKDEFSAHGDFAEQSRKVDDYWKALGRVH
jgi:sporulation protein YlmC with PRC-barrel domain